MRIIEVSDAGREVLSNKGAVLIGLSIRNSYFRDEENLRQIYQWAADSFSKVFVMIPDLPAIYTLMSYGNPENKARQKAQLAANALENKLQAIVVGIKSDTEFFLVRWAPLEDNQDYLSSYKKLENLYHTNASFQADIRSVTKSVIEGHGTSLDINQAIEIGVQFLLKELALISNSASILGVPECAYMYHRLLPVHKDMLEGKYGLTFPQNSGYLVAEVG